MKQTVIASVLIISCALFAGAAFSDDAASNSTAAAAPAAQTGAMPARLQPMALLAQPPNCLLSTGSRIVPKEGCISMANGRTYDRQELNSFGDLTFGESLSRDPSITIQNHR